MSTAPSQVAKPTERIALKTTPQPPVLCQLPFLLRPSQFVQAWDRCGVLHVKPTDAMDGGSKWRIRIKGNWSNRSNESDSDP